MCTLTSPASPGAMMVVPRWLRICLLVRLIMPWRLPDWVALILPVAVTENRFLQDDFVLSLGISLSFRCNEKPPWHALYRPGGSINGRAYNRAGRENASLRAYGSRRSRQAIDRPARITSATPMKVLRCGTS